MSDANIKPLIGDQVTAGYYHNLFTNLVEASVEVYYKRMKNTLDYKAGAELLLNPDLEVDIISVWESIWNRTTPKEKEWHVKWVDLLYLFAISA